MNEEFEVWSQDHNWRPLLRGKCFKSASIQLPKPVVDLLNMDSIILDSSTEDEEVKAIVTSNEYTSFIQELETKILEIGSEGVIPRLNWSIPK